MGMMTIKIMVVDIIRTGGTEEPMSWRTGETEEWRK